MKLSAAMERYVLHWGEMGTRWGVNRSIAQVHALLYLSERPLHAEEIADTLEIARSNVSNSLKTLQGWRLVRLAHVLGDRRDHFEAEADPWAICFAIVEGRKRREIDPTREMLEACVAQARAEDDTGKFALRRLEAMQGFLREFSEWYDDLCSLPPTTIRKLVKLGGRIGKIVTG